MARKKKIHHRHNRLSFGGKLAFVLLTILSAVILIPIVFRTKRNEKPRRKR